MSKCHKLCVNFYSGEWGNFILNIIIYSLLGKKAMLFMRQIRANFIHIIKAEEINEFKNILFAAGWVYINDIYKTIQSLPLDICYKYTRICQFVFIVLTYIIIW